MGLATYLEFEERTDLAKIGVMLQAMILLTAWFLCKTKLWPLAIKQHLLMLSKVRTSTNTGLQEHVFSFYKLLDPQLSCNLMDKALEMTSLVAAVAFKKDKLLAM